MRSFVIVSCAVLVAVVLAYSVQHVVGKPAPVEAIAIQDDGQRRPFGRGPGAGSTLAAMLGRDELAQTVSLLADLNLTPTFTLSPDQKTKIQAIRDRAKQAQENWRKENQAQLDKLSEESRTARDAAAGPGGGNQELRQKRQDLMATAPKVDDAAKEIVDVLTPEQRKAYDDALAQRREDQQQARERGRGQFPGGGGGGARRPLQRN